MSSINLDVDVAEVFEPFLQDSRYKGAHGGRGSGKSHFFAELAVTRSILRAPQRIICAREIQKSLKDSAKLLIEDKIRKLDAPGFQIKTDEILTPRGGIIAFQGMRDHNADTIKSYEGFDVAWVEEAHRLTAKSLQLLRPTIRKPGSELWFSWNPFRRTDPVDSLLRGSIKPGNAIVVRANWSDNPWFPSELEAERQHDRSYSPSYRHIWEGDYATVVEGAYFAKDLALAKEQKRLTQLFPDPLIEIKTFWDLGFSDSTAIWVAQFNQRRIDVLDYIEGQGQSLPFYTNWLRENGYVKAAAYLPHDGAGGRYVNGKRLIDMVGEAGFRVPQDTEPSIVNGVVGNAGSGAAMQRVEAARRLFPRIYFDEKRCGPGLEALGAYHEKRDDTRQIGLGPEHDWSSHGADAFGLMCMVYAPPEVKQAPRERFVYTQVEGEQGQSWMGA